LEEDYISIKHGPRFEGMPSTIGMFGAIGFIIYGSWLISEDLASALVMYFIAIVCIFIFLDFRGVNIDFKRNRIRQYRNMLMIRHGKWETLSDFKKVSLTLEQFKTMSASSLISQSFNSKSHDSYFVILEGEEGIIPFEIGEYEAHSSAKSTMKWMADKLNIPSEDLYGERKKKAAKIQSGRRKTGRRN
jgi:hypothetical protein